MPHPHVTAAFINAIADEGTRAEAIDWLQKQWNETCALRAALKFYATATDADWKNDHGFTAEAALAE